jgi:hypothetical protein
MLLAVRCAGGEYDNSPLILDIAVSSLRSSFAFAGV